MTGFIYLASQSPRRRELLSQIGVVHRVVNVNVPEVHSPNETAKDYVVRLALEKAQAGNHLVNTSGLELAPVLGADTIVVIGDLAVNERILEKPVDRTHFIEMMSLLSGQTHKVMTAVALVQAESVASLVSTTEVTFKSLSEQDVLSYWLSGEPKDKAGGYAIQGLGAVFVEKLSGSYSGVVGLPLAETATLLKEFDSALLQSA